MEMETRYQKIVVEAGDTHVKLLLEDDGKKIIFKAKPNWTPEEAYFMGMTNAQKERIVEYLKKEKIKSFKVVDSKKRKLVTHWSALYKPKNAEEEIFLSYTKQAVEEIKKIYYIATLQASIEEKAIYYSKGAQPFLGEGSTSYQLEILAKAFAPERHSAMATLGQLYMWNAFLVANGTWTIKEVIENMTEIPKLVKDKETYVIVSKELQEVSQDNTDFTANVQVVLN